MKTKFVIFILFITTQIITAQPNSWTEINTSSVQITPRRMAASFEINGILYLGTGKTGTGYLNSFFKYNPLTDVWTELADFPGNNRCKSVGFAINGKGYIGLGADGTTIYDDIWEFDPATEQWSNAPIATIPEALQSAVAFTIGDNVYVGTGGTNIGLSTGSKKFYRWNQTNNQWLQVASLSNTERHGAVSFSINNKGYVGLGNTPSQNIDLKDFWEYDPQTDVWTVKALYPGLVTNRCAAFSLCNQAYVATGYGYTDTDYYKDLYQYNPQDNTWLEMNDFDGTARDGSSAQAVNDVAYLFGGFSTGDQKDLWKYTPPICQIITGATEKTDEIFSIFPNPANELLTVNTKNTTPKKLIISAIDGRIMIEKNIEQTDIIDIKLLPKGLFFYSIIDNSGQASRGSFIKI